jgi:osmotically-inducible protein OsmY
MSRIRFERLLVVAALLVTVAACARQQEQPPQDSGTTSSTTLPRSDTALATEVQGRFFADDLVRAGRIDVVARDGVVTVEGTAATEEAKQRALQLARDVEGVNRVDDRLSVADATTQAESLQEASAQQRMSDGSGTVGTGGARSAADGPPGWITAQIQAKYFLSGDVKPWNIDVTTSAGGVVELRGEVESAQAKAEAVRLARAVDGVTRVEDRLRVRGAAQEQARQANAHTAVEEDDTSDAWLTTKVQSKYFLDPDIGGLDIDVTTENGVVTLSGDVSNAAERRQAIAIARNTDGVRDVRDQLQMNLTQRQSDATGTRARTFGERVDDLWVTTKVQSQYFIDTAVKGHEINVDTRNGIVTLKGTVDTQAAKAAAEQIARDTRGVARVNNQLMIAPARTESPR